MYFRILIRRLPRFRVLHVVYPVGISPLAWPLLMVLAGKFFGLKVVLDYPGPLTLSRLRGKSLLVQKFWHLSDRVLVPSRYQQQLVNMLGGRASCVHHPAVCGRISPRTIDRVQPKLLVVADLEEENNIACLIRAYKLVKQKYPRTELAVIGSGSQRTGLERLLGADTRSGVTFVSRGDRPERHRWFAACDLYVNCSTVDCLTGATLEAMAHGLPVLTTPLGSDLTAFRDHDNIISFSYNNHGALADRIIELVEEPGLVQSLSRRARETAQLLERQMAPLQCRDLYRSLTAD
ncbi:MAG: glycosyltransferase family 4 protein [Candidatus Zixiibacteriota bacterium]|nr:MAG: glycosyltransferase family 4 protein [candidate division Zixibacteria bacterium]